MTDRTLVERLRETYGQSVLDEGTLVMPMFHNRDGYEAADTILALEQRVKVLEASGAVPPDQQILIFLGAMRDDMPPEDVAAVQRFVDRIRAALADKGEG